MTASLSSSRRRELASFLRDRRGRLQPEEVGLPRGRRRRTPGLRREEVASLAGLSPEWYKRLEQARDVRASAQALASIGQALRLEPGERRHLLQLAGYPDERERAATQAGDLGAHIQQLIDQLRDCPCWITGERWDYLAWNDAATLITGDLSQCDELERNALYQFFLGSRIKGSLQNWGHHARGLVGVLRADYARWIEDPWFNEIIQVLERESPQFAEMWTARELTAYQDGTKEYHFSDLGQLSFDYTALRLSDERHSNLSLIAYIPRPATGTRERLLAALAG